MTLLLSDVDGDRVAYLKWHVVSNKESLTVNDLIVPADELIPLMCPDLFHFLIDILVRLCTDVVAASLNREFQSLQRHRASRCSNRTLTFVVDLVN